jgi:hypothetical protein
MLDRSLPVSTFGPRPPAFIAPATGLPVAFSLASFVTRIARRARSRATGPRGPSNTRRNPA